MMSQILIHFQETQKVGQDIIQNLSAFEFSLLLLIKSF